MGSDIHFFVEKKSPRGSWLSADHWEIEDGQEVVPYEKCRYHQRNYNLFAILADVRNGTGFAGKPTGNGFTPIAKPKGLPLDVSPQVKAIATHWGCDGHSHSWLTLAELQAFDWNQTTLSYGQEGTYADLVDMLGKQWFEETMPALIELADGHPESVRIVFFFDN